MAHHAALTVWHTTAAGTPAVNQHNSLVNRSSHVGTCRSGHHRVQLTGLGMSRRGEAVSGCFIQCLRGRQQGICGSMLDVLPCAGHPE